MVAFYGSITNRINESKPASITDLPAEGDGATLYHWSDRTAWTVTKVGGTAKRPVVTIQRDTVTRTDANGMSETQSYTFAPNWQGNTLEVRFTVKRGFGAWRAGDTVVVFGERREYLDLSF